MCSTRDKYLQQKRKHINFNWLYLPHKTTEYSELIDLLSTLSLKYSDAILAGDFNSNILIEKHLSNDMESLGLFPVKYPTHFSTTCNTLLDVFYVSDCKKIQNFEINIVFCLFQT